MIKIKYFFKSFLPINKVNINNNKGSYITYLIIGDCSGNIFGNHQNSRNFLKILNIVSGK